MSYVHRQASKPRHHPFRKLFLFTILLLVLASAATYAWNRRPKTDTPSLESSSTLGQQAVTKSSTQKPAPAPNACAGNALANLVVVSISQQHLWACAGASQVYDNAVITGMELYPADLTPTGTYHIYAKSTAQTLAGHDSTGSWSDFVNYWMPFLDNQYGTYGFHDLTQIANGANGRADSDFGNVNINLPYTAAKHASHGCVELPLAAAKWLYGWAPVGTTVTITS